jgi:GntR family transcriptional regulator
MLWNRCHVNNDRAEWTVVTAQIRRAINEREALPGERLPPARDLAAELGVSTKTVRRSLRLLREEGLIVKRLGLRVAGGSEPAQPGAAR